MDFYTYNCGNIPASVNIASFRDKRVDEITDDTAHAIRKFDTQLEWMSAHILRFLIPSDSI